MDSPYKPQLAHSHQQHSPTRATTQEFLMFICHPKSQLKRSHFEPQLEECHVLNPYPEPKLKGYILIHNSRNTNKLTFEISPKPYTPRTSKSQNTFGSFACSYCLSDQPLPPGIAPLCRSLKLQLSPGGSKPTARHCTSNIHYLVHLITTPQHALAKSTTSCWSTIVLGEHMAPSGVVHPTKRYLQVRGIRGAWRLAAQSF
ncbi:hypothetical protein DEO72_LG6g1028 [Vigna unguiculata]|uniref:Uncharacterized protein n=1 Tax=Vigna unguiculata TaxID=3917 RepID=A0A4D6M877_VIGUN|nr:hypothetical protein DEO72_LG6g1028 [Vigna unguiculata]